MIPRAYIDAWRSHAPWRSDARVEQDLIICRALVEIFRHSVLSRQLVFRGGTALHKLFFTSPRRYSEDIDLVQIEAGPIGPIFDGLRRYMANAGLTVSRREFELNLATKREHPGFATDLADLLPVGNSYEFESGFAVVEHELLARL